MKLNLPLYSLSDGQKQRVALAKARATSIATELIASVSKPDTKELETLIDTILASGTIPSLKAASEIANTPDPNPYKEDREKTINRSGYAIVNGSNIFKLSESTNIEPLRMLYMAGYSIEDIRKIVSNMTPSSTFVCKVGRAIASFSLDQKEILHNTSYRFYSLYYTKDDKSYVVYDTKDGDFGYYAIVCEQDENSRAYFKCTPKKFPITGKLEIVVNNNLYSVELNAEFGKELETQLRIANIPDITIEYNNGLSFSSEKSFHFVASDTAYNLGIKDELIVAQTQIKEGYTGYSVIGEGAFPYNCQVKKPVASSANSRVIYNNLVSQGLPEEYARKYINGELYYDNLKEDCDSILETLDDKVLTRNKIDEVYRKSNVRIETITYQAVKVLLELSDTDLEYLLRYREDLEGIDPYVTKQECVDGIVSTFNSNVSSSSKSQSHLLDAKKKGPRSNHTNWKRQQEYVRTMAVYSYEYDDEDDRTARQKLEDFLGGINEGLDTLLYTETDLYSAEGYYSETSLGMDFAGCANLSSVFSIAGGVQCVANSKNNISLTAYNDFVADCMVIEAYLNAAFEVFTSIMNTIKRIISLLNSSLTVFSGSGTASLGVDSILQCSISLDLAIILPPYLNALSVLLEPFIGMLAELADAIVGLVEKILCPIQNFLDKYLNTRNFVLPCKINYKVPIIYGIDAYLKGYLSALLGLQALCLSSSKDVNWLRKNLAMMPGSVDLLVINSANCKES